MERQTLPAARVLVAEGGSTDGTREILDDWKGRLPITVIANPGRRQGPGLNRCLRHTRAAYLARLDGHTRWSPRYLERLVGRLRDRNELAAAGARVRVDPDASPFQRTVWGVMRHPLGTGGPAYRRAERPDSVPSLQSPVYRRSALIEVGGFREDLPWAEDDELHHRLRRHGWKLHLDPGVSLYYRPRDRWLDFARQSAHYGHGRASLARRGIYPDPRHRWIDRGLKLWTFGLVWNPLGWFLGGLYLLTVLAAWGARRVRDSDAGPWFPLLMVTMQASYWWGWMRHRFSGGG